MLYAVLQTTLDLPPKEKLRQALLAVPGMVAFDVDIILRDAFGILLREQPLETAAIFQRGLSAQGIETELVPEASLPKLPGTKFVRRLEVTPEALQVYDPIGRRFPVEWGHLYLVAAGMVRVTEFMQQRKMVRPAQVHPGHFGGYQQTEPEFESVTREGRADKLFLEILLGRGAARLSIEADPKALMLFSYLGQRRTGELSRDFGLLVNDLLQRAPDAAVNRGSHYLREKGDQIFYYPTKNAFLEEIVWLLWQMNKPT
jgi:hypothetical protein